MTTTTKIHFFYDIHNEIIYILKIIFMSSNIVDSVGLFFENGGNGEYGLPFSFDIQDFAGNSYYILTSKSLPQNVIANNEVKVSESLGFIGKSKLFTKCKNVWVSIPHPLIV